MGNDDMSVMTFKIPHENREVLKRAASAAGMTFSAWARLILESAAGVSELPEHLKRVVREKGEVPDGRW